LFVAIDGGGPTSETNLPQPYGVAWTSGDTVVWSASSGAEIFLSTDGSSTPLAPGENGPTAVAAAGSGSIFWLLTGSNTVRAKFTNVTTLSDGVDTQPSQIAADAKAVYWIDSDLTKPGLGRLRKSTDSGPITIAANFTLNTTPPIQSPKIALNSKYVYWLTQDSILRYTRP